MKELLLDEQTDGQMDRQVGGWIDGWTNRQIGGWLNT